MVLSALGCCFVWWHILFQMQQYQQAFLQQQMLAQHPQSQPQASPEYLTSPQEFSPALVSYSSSLPAQVGPMMDSSYSANRQVFFHWIQRKSLWEWVLSWSWSHFINSSGSWIWSPSFFRVPPFLLLVLSSGPCASLSSFPFSSVNSDNCYLQIRLSNIQQHLRLRKGKGKLLSKAKLLWCLSTTRA